MDEWPIPPSGRGYGTAWKTINGLGVYLMNGAVGAPSPEPEPGNAFMAYVPQLGIGFGFVPPGSDPTLMGEILATVTLAEHPMSVPSRPSTKIPADQRLSYMCAVVDQWRKESAAEKRSVPGPSDLQLFTFMRSMAPPEMVDDLTLTIGWLQRGAPEPVPAEVTAATNRSTVAWATYCPLKG